MQFILANWQTILLIVVVIAVVAYLVINRKWNELRLIAYRLMKEAEDAIKGNKRGQERFNEVFTKLYALIIPEWLQIFITEERLKAKLQQWFDEIKDYLDNGKMDGSIDTTDAIASRKKRF